MSEIDQQFIEYVVKSLVGNPDAVHVDRRVDEKGVLLELTVDPEDLGRVIGKRGATAQSLRTLLRALGTKNDARYNLKIVDNGPEDRQAKKETDDSTTDDKPKAAKKTQKSTDDDTDVSDNTSVTDDVAQDDTEEVEEESDRLAQTRAELADLDDLEI